MTEIPDRSKTPRIAHRRAQALGVIELPEIASTASTDAPAPPHAPSDRAIDPERAGGTGNAAPMTVEDALAYFNGRRWQHFAMTAELAGYALADEVERLRGELAGAADLERRESAAWRAAYRMAAADAARLHAAPAPDRIVPPVFFGCALGKGAACDHAAAGAESCCRILALLVQIGAIPAPERPAQEDDGA